MNVFDSRDKGVPADLIGQPLDAIIGRSINDGTFPSPLAVAYRDRIEHTLSTMARYCRSNAIEIAPHAKTTMAPSILERQIRHGAWGLTVATIVQARTLFSLGYSRLVLANQLVNDAGLRWARAASMRGLDLTVFVDSLEGITAIGASADTGSIGVLIEIGGDGGRAGLRNTSDAVALAEAAIATEGVSLRGVAGYEGVFFDSAAPTPHIPVRKYLARIRDTFIELKGLGLFDEATPAVVTAGGSACFQDVVDVLGPLATNDTVVVIRSGCYATHDHGVYQQVSPLRDSPEWPEFQGAIVVIAQVLSRPEPSLAILDAGRRDVSFDEGLPTPLVHVHNDISEPVPPSWRVTKLMDQHAYLDVEPGRGPRVGDYVHLGISHPCTTIDKWRYIPEIDQDGVVVDLISPEF